MRVLYRHRGAHVLLVVLFGDKELGRLLCRIDEFEEVKMALGCPFEPEPKTALDAPQARNSRSRV